MYNSLKYTKTLEATGFTREQAEATINLVIETMDYHFATKTDLQFMETNIRSDMKDMETSLRSDMKDMETSLRSDMKDMETSLRSDMKDMRAEMKEIETSIRSDMRFMESRMTLRLGGIMLGGIALLEFLRST